MSTASSPPPRDEEVCPNCHGSRMAMCGLPCDTCLDTGTRAGYERWKGVVPAAPSEPPAADSPTPGTETHLMLAGSHEQPGGAECRCGAPWDRWNDRCTRPAAPSPVDTTEPPAETQQDDEPCCTIDGGGRCNDCPALAARPSADSETLRARISDLLIDHMPTETARGYVCDCYGQGPQNWREHVAGLIAALDAR